MVTFCKTLRQCHSQGVDIDTVRYRAFHPHKGPPSCPFIAMPSSLSPLYLPKPLATTDIIHFYHFLILECSRNESIHYVIFEDWLSVSHCNSLKSDPRHYCINSWFLFTAG